MFSDEDQVVASKADGPQFESVILSFPNRNGERQVATEEARTFFGQYPTLARGAVDNVEDRARKVSALHGLKLRIEALDDTPIGRARHHLKERFAEAMKRARPASR